MRIQMRYLRRTLIALVLVFAFTASALAVGFPDTEGHWAEKEIDYWTQTGVIAGYPDGNFCPDQGILRGEVAKILAEILDLEAESGQQHFADVGPDHWAYSAIEACAQWNIFTGSDGKFFPSREISRQEAMTVIYRATTYQSSDPKRLVEEAPDGSDVADWAVEAVGTLMECHVIEGYPDGSIDPQSSITRAEFVTILYRIQETEHWDSFGLPASTLVNLAWQSPAGDNVRLCPQSVDGVDYLFLPAAADLEHLNLNVYVEEGVTVTYRGNLGQTQEQTFDLTAVAAKDEDGVYALEITAECGDQSASRSLKILHSANVGAMFLTSSDPVNQGRSYVDAVKGNATTGDMVLLEPDGAVTYDGSLSQIKSRGNSTFLYYPKKPYQIKLNKKTDLIGNGEKGKTWVLLAAYADASMFRDKLCKDLAADMGMAESPDCRWVDLYYDGEYRGTYLLSEKVQIGGNGVDIVDLEAMYEEINEGYGDDVELVSGQNAYGNFVQYVAGLTDPENISNGYLLELNYKRGDENSWFMTSRNLAINIKAPENVSQAAANYVSEFYQEFEDAVYAVDETGLHTGINPDTGKSYEEYCDLDSLAQMYLIYFFSYNRDAYVQSTFFYVSDGMFYAGPIWDSDQTFGIGWDEDIPTDRDLPWEYLVHELEQIPSFQAAVKRFYEGGFRELALEYADNRVPGYLATLTATEQMNHVLWPDYYRWSGMGSTFEEGTTYAQVTQQVSQWMYGRLEYLDQKFANWG